MGIQTGHSVRYNEWGFSFKILFFKSVVMSIQSCSLSSSAYMGHSFQIDAASHAADKGLSDAQIGLSGGCKSNAYRILECLLCS